MNLEITPTLQVEALNLLNGNLIKIVGRVQCKLNFQKRVYVLTFVLINEPLDYVIFGRMVLEILLPKLYSQLLSENYTRFQGQLSEECCIISKEIQEFRVIMLKSLGVIDNLKHTILFLKNEIKDSRSNLKPEKQDSQNKR